MNEMVERVAQAIHADRCTVERTWEQEAPTMREFYLLCARGAIDAMRHELHKFAGVTIYDERQFGEMIDEALTDLPDPETIRHNGMLLFKNMIPEGAWKKID